MPILPVAVVQTLVVCMSWEEWGSLRTGLPVFRELYPFVISGVPLLLHCAIDPISNW